MVGWLAGWLAAVRCLDAFDSSCRSVCGQGPVSVRLMPDQRERGCAGASSKAS